MSPSQRAAQFEIDMVAEATIWAAGLSRSAALAPVVGVVF